MQNRGTIKKPEIMSPAGDWISLRAALQEGCDAVYFGIAGMNMRAGARNFTIDDLAGVAELCHKYQARAYLALNTIVYEHEIPYIKEYVKQARKAKIDAIICWDFTVISEALDQGMPVFISTQMSVANSASILFFYRNFGIRRFVLARECSLNDILAMRTNLEQIMGDKSAEIELEVFVHGAMCVSISGRCFLSQFHTGKSANRGQCLQPCRREYLITDMQDNQELAIGNNYIISPKDICALPFIEKLINAGVASFKIEGRNRSPEYVAAVTAAYRKAVDFYCENANKQQPDFQNDFSDLKQELLVKVRKVYNRGFSSGFYLGKPLNEWTDRYGSSATARKEYVGVVTNYYRKPQVAEIKIESTGFCEGDELLFLGTTTGALSDVAASIEINRERVPKACKGTVVGVKLHHRVRPKDQVYVLTPQNTNP